MDTLWHMVLQTIESWLGWSGRSGINQGLLVVGEGLSISLRINSQTQEKSAILCLLGICGAELEFKAQFERKTWSSLEYKNVENFRCWVKVITYSSRKMNTWPKQAGLCHCHVIEICEKAPVDFLQAHLVIIWFTWKLSLPTLSRQLKLSIFKNVFFSCFKVLLLIIEVLQVSSNINKAIFENPDFHSEICGIEDHNGGNLLILVFSNAPSLRLNKSRDTAVYSIKTGYVSSRRQLNLNWLQNQKQLT